MKNMNENAAQFQDFGVPCLLRASHRLQFAGARSRIDR